MTTKPSRAAKDIERARGQENQILSMLRAAGPAGCTNSQLSSVAHAVNSRASELRKRGHRITAEAEGGGLWRYRLTRPESERPSRLEPRQRSELEQQAPLFATPEAR
jgi:hypothetical protein